MNGYLVYRQGKDIFLLDEKGIQRHKSTTARKPQNSNNFKEEIIMVIQHNLQAMNANRMLGIQQRTVAGLVEKLSSGFRINRAADNAAGLSISEKMRKQIRGLSQAAQNAEDGISLVQTAEGALQEVTDMLQRMNELAVQAANGTNSETDRKYIQDEINQLITEIDRVSETSKFNETYLLKGDKSGNGRIVYTESYHITYTRNTRANNATVSYQMNYQGNTALIIATNTVAGSAGTVTTSWSRAMAVVLSSGDDITEYIGGGNQKIPATANQVSINTNSYSAYKLTTASGIKTSISVNCATGAMTIKDGTNNLFVLDKENNQIICLKQGSDISKYIKNVQVDAKGENVTFMQANDGYQFLDVLTDPNDLKVAAIAKKSEAQLYDGQGNAVSSVGLRNHYNQFGVYQESSLYADSEGKTKVSNNKIDSYVNRTATRVADDLRIALHVGADSSPANKIIVNIKPINAASLGIDVLSSAQGGIVDVTGEKATAAIDVISNALQVVSRQRSELGAIQNRLEHTIKNLNSVIENTTNAESTIRDTDMAKAMMQFSNHNIIMQVGQAMLAQANSSNQGVLALLR